MWVLHTRGLSHRLVSNLGAIKMSAVHTRHGRSLSHSHTRIESPGFGTVTDIVFNEFDAVSSDVKSGGSNPHWKDQIRSVTQAGTGYARQTTLGGFVSGKVSGTFHPAGTYDERRDYHELSGQFQVGPGVPDLPDISTLQIQAKLKFIQKARSMIRLFQGGVFLGELRETLQMIIRPASALRRRVSLYSSSAKKAFRRERTPPSRARALSGTWLEHSYGWRPFFRDIDEGMEALSDTNHLVPQILAATESDVWKSASQDVSFSGPGVFISGDLVFQPEHTGRVRYLGCVAWESLPPRDWQSKWGVTLSDFAPTVWELIPYSFLVDYFSNVGAVIDASSFGTVSLRWGICSAVAESRIYLTKQSARWNSSSVSEPASASASLGLSPLSQWRFNRSLVEKLEAGIADVRGQMPGVGDWRKWANMAALAIEKTL